MAVSKLCCPACWEYLHILSRLESSRPGGNVGWYKIRGRHSTVYPVQLPDWSPPDVVRELIKRFDQYLSSELDTMRMDYLLREDEEQAKQAVKHGHRHNPSLQSVSSAITNMSETSVQSNLDDFDHELPMPHERGVEEVVALRT
jgi:hypothetical protein